MSETDTEDRGSPHRRHLWNVWRMRYSKDSWIALATHLWLPTQTKVAHECSRKASVAEQISWDVTVEMWLFEKEKAFGCDEAVLEEPLTDDESHAEFDVAIHELPMRCAEGRGSR